MSDPNKLELEEFNRAFVAETIGSADADGIYTRDAFFELAQTILSEAGEIDSGTQSYHLGRRGAKNIEIDGYGGDPRDTNGILSLIYLDFNNDPLLTPKNASEIKPLFQRLVEFLRAARDEKYFQGIEETSDGYGLIDLIRATWKRIEKIKLIVFSNCDSRARIDAFPGGTIDEIPVTYNLWDIKRIKKFTEQGLAREDLVIDFKNDYGGGVPILKASNIAADYESYLAVISGEQLAALYEKWGSRLLESNVRSFLQARGNVNKGIRNTIVEEPDMFLAYNNGISATAENIELGSDETGKLLLSANNLQIVNGGQTTASLHAVRKTATEQLKKVFVQMKLSIVPKEKAEAIVPKISEYANSQNKVNAADFFSNHPFHVRMEELSRKLLAPSGNGQRETKWFYERARGQYADARAQLSQAERKKFDAEYPKPQFFTKTDLAKFDNSFSAKPHVVSLGAQKNFADFAGHIGKRWGEEGEFFDEIWFKRLIAKAIVFKATEKLVSNAIWYEKGYRANIVTYGIAKFVSDASARHKVIDLDRIWRAQHISSELETGLMIACAEAQQVILSPDGGVRNIGEWAKKQACWKRLSDLELEYPTAVEDALISIEEARSIADAGRKDIAITDGVELQKRVFELGSEFWQKLLAWGTENRLLSPREAGILKTCSGIPQEIPSERQCVLAMKTMKKLSDLGFTHDMLD